MVAKTDDAEEHGQDNETAELNWLASDGIHSRDRDPIPRNSTRADQDDVANRNVPEIIVDIVVIGVSNGGQNGSVVKTNPVESLKAT